MLRGQTNGHGSVSVLLYLISFYLDRLNISVKVSLTEVKEWQKAIIVLYLDATMIVNFLKSMYRFLREKTPHTISVLQESKPEVQGLDQKASQEEFQGEQTH